MKVGQSVLSAASCSLLTGRCAVVSRPAVCSGQQAVSVVRRASRGGGARCVLVVSVDRQPLLVAFPARGLRKYGLCWNDS